MVEWRIVLFEEREDRDERGRYQETQFWNTKVRNFVFILYTPLLSIFDIQLNSLSPRLNLLLVHFSDYLCFPRFYLLGSVLALPRPIGPIDSAQPGPMKWLILTYYQSCAMDRLVDELGLRSTLTEYHVPKEDLPGIATRALARENDPMHAKVVQLLESLY